MGSLAAAPCHARNGAEIWITGSQSLIRLCFQHKWIASLCTASVLSTPPAQCKVKKFCGHHAHKSKSVRKVELSCSNLELENWTSRLSVEFFGKMEMLPGVRWFTHLSRHVIANSAAECIRRETTLPVDLKKVEQC